MARTSTIISIFIASPSDVEKERDVVSQKVLEWNTRRSKDLGVEFEVLKWETRVSAGFGTDGQDVINQQIANDYDVLLMLFWNRYGSETPRASSGTIEEYERALLRRKNDENVDIAVFFKEAPVSRKSIDLDQLRALQDFEQRVHSDGALSKSFLDDDALRFETDLLLDRLARQMSNGTTNTHLITRNSILSDTLEAGSFSSNPEDGIALFDIIEAIDLHVNEAASFLTVVTEALDLITKETESVTQEYNVIGKIRPIEISDSKPLIARITRELSNFSDLLSQGIPSFKENTFLMAQDVRHLIDVSYEFSPKAGEFTAFQSTLSLLADGMGASNESMIEFLGAISSLPRTTTEFNRARRAVTDNVSRFVKTTEATRQLVMEAAVELDALIMRVERDQLSEHP